MLVQAIADFCRQTDKYDFLRQQSDEYRNQINADACIILAKNEPFPVLSFATGDGASLELTNIVPGSVSALDISAYNCIVTGFVKAFARFARTLSPIVTLHCTKPELTLESVLPAKTTRELFRRYLSNNPTSGHPMDNERLDRFTCAVSSYCRGRIDTIRLRRYLMEILHWTETRARQCTERIETGLDVLRVKREF